ncbi:MAG: hypothetical protein V3T21_00980 [Candidatus Margulisiibacteriota bacterium]
MAGEWVVEINMEISKIEEASQVAVGQEVRMQKLKGRVCIYFPEMVCSAPRLQFGICRACPRAAQYIRKNAIRSIFDYIKSFAISLLKSMDIQLSK